MNYCFQREGVLHRIPSIYLEEAINKAVENPCQKQTKRSNKEHNQKSRGMILEMWTIPTRGEIAIYGRSDSNTYPITHYDIKSTNCQAIL